VTANTNSSRNEGHHRVRVAHAVAGLRLLRAALAAGDVGIEQARLFGRAWTNRHCRQHLPRVEADLVRFAVELPLPDFELVMKRFIALADPDGTVRNHDTAHRNRRASTSTIGASWEMHAFADALAGEEFDNILQHFIDLEYNNDWEQAKAEHGDNFAPGKHLSRTARQRRFDALMAMARAAKSATRAIAHEPSIVIVTDPSTTIDAILEDAGLPVTPIDPRQFNNSYAETLRGTPIPRHVLLAALQLGRVQVMFHEPGTRNVEMGRQARFHNRAMRLALSVLDRFCAGPGCHQPADHTQADHVQAWDDGGDTGIANGASLCGPDNRNKHRLKLKLHHNPKPHSSWTWTTHNGTPITPTTRPHTNRGPPPDTG
jgi:Domain of unknown function (DUF222)/HNH endonuclease